MSTAALASRNPATAGDSELVDAARAGEDEAFEELYRRYHGQIAAFARRIVHDHGRGEDVAQEAFVSALRRLRETECEIQFKPWIYEITRNAAIDSLRRAGRAEEVSFEVHGAADAEQFAAPAAPDACVIGRERFENFRGALEELSDSHHRIIVMRELEGLSYREIGARMQLSPAAVESTLFRARRKLGHEYAQLDTGRRCQSMGTVIARLAEGMESRPDRVRLDRHARRCSSCRARARRLGVEPILAGSVRRRAAALLPLPGFLRGPRGLNPRDAFGASRVQQAVGAVANPSFESVFQGVGKVAAVVASALAVGGMGATLGGIGPLAADGAETPTVEKRTGERNPGTRTGSDREAVVPRRGSPELGPPGSTGGADQKSSSPKDERSDRGVDGTRAPGESGPSESGSPVLPGVPNVSPAERREVSVPDSLVETGPAPDLAAPSLPSGPQAPSPPEAPVIPSQDGVLTPVRAAPGSVGEVKAPSASLPPA